MDDAHLDNCLQPDLATINGNDKRNDVIYIIVSKANHQILYHGNDQTEIHNAIWKITDGAIEMRIYAPNKYGSVTFEGITYAPKKNGSRSVHNYHFSTILLKEDLEILIEKFKQGD